jgi:sec-independent protein translocase protein TatA
MFGPVGWNELVVILIIVLVIFGPKRLPELAEAMGKSIRKFKEASRDVKEEVTSAVTKEETKS